jgi:hypothetical protein
MVKLETRIPAGFIGGLTALIPQVRGGGSSSTFVHVSAVALPAVLSQAILR